MVETGRHKVATKCAQWKLNECIDWITIGVMIDVRDLIPLLKIVNNIISMIGINVIPLVNDTRILDLLGGRWLEVDVTVFS